MSKETALKACPFCRHDAGIGEGGGRYYVQCMSQTCFAALGERYDRDAMPEHAFATAEEAAAAWNRRRRSTAK
jgi:hypothetical protein